MGDGDTEGWSGGRPDDGAADEHERTALATWLAERLGADGPVRVGDYDRPSSGFSAETVIVPVAYERRGAAVEERVVLRKEVPDPAVYPVQVPGLDVEVDIQYRCMAALAATGTVPLAPLVGYEGDPSLLGTPFFVMGYVEGQVPTESPAYTEAGFFVEATPEQRRSLVTSGVRTMAAVHAVDWRAAGLDFLVAPGTTPGTAHQLDLWSAYARRELDGRIHPGLAEAFRWLPAHVPADEDLTFCWGDPRPGNVIWRDFRPACVTDFEAAYIGAPGQDVGWWLMFDRTMHPDGSRPEGEPTRDEQRDIYVDASGRDPGDLAFHEVFAAFRYAAIVVRIMNRLVGRGDLPADQTIWLENPASDVLAEVLATLT